MTKSHLHKIIIPKPPDRGGRTCEMSTPPTEMPSFMQRKSSTNPQGQRQASKGGGSTHDGGPGYHRNKNNQRSNDRPQSDFERFQDSSYGSNDSSYGSNRYRGGKGGSSGKGGYKVGNQNNNNRW